MTAAETGLARPHVHLAAEPSASGPPLLLLHGTGGTEHDLLPLRALLSPGAAVLSPRGQVLEAGMPRWFRRLAEGVFDEADLSRRADELAEFVTAASAEHGLAERSLVAVGFSNGSNIASALMLRHPGLLRGALLVAAMLPYAEPPAADLTGLDVLISNGARDPMIPHSMTEELERQLSERGARVVDLPHAGGHQLDQQVLQQAAVALAAL